MLPAMTAPSAGVRRQRRQRLDLLLVERGLAPSVERARALILARDVLVGGEPVDRAGAPLPPDAELALRERPRYVSRGGEKLAPVLARAGIDVVGRRCLDVGASTGGFTDCLLQRGAASVVAVDVGYGQLALSLREDPRVEVRERTHARDLPPLDPPVDLVTVDVSFISLRSVLPAALRSVRPGGLLMPMVKPQFEVPRAEVERGGVVRDGAVQARAVGRVLHWAQGAGLRAGGVYRAALTGPAGNREFFLLLRVPAA
jgi:23S rRNA (cytidine1920-2'-O)/16S rRNA (cytidine1409-2'-O)-methyltransferase